MSVPTGMIEDHRVILQGDDAITVYNRGYYGLPGGEGVVLTGFEALHLVELGRIQVQTDGKEMTEQNLMTYFSNLLDNFMGRYLVYKDLRNRGYVVNQGRGSSFFFRLYKRGDIPKQNSAAYYITPLQEGTSINLPELDDLVKLAKHSKKDLVFGLVDASGDVSYLQVNQLYPEGLSNRIFSSLQDWNWQEVWNDYLSWE